MKRDGWVDENSQAHTHWVMTRSCTKEKGAYYISLLFPGTILRADVAGQILMRAYLSGTPECKFGLNDKLLLDNDVVNRTK